MSKIKPNLGKDFCVLERVPEYLITDLEFLCNDSTILTIIDLETTGLDYKTDKITEIGVLSAAFDDHNESVDVVQIYQSFNDPGVPISPQITKLTGITDAMVKDQVIDWQAVKDIVEKSTLVVCHNAAFDRKFLEQTPIGEVFKAKVFACSKSDIDWQRREYGATKLDYLNWKMGYFYDGHRAINDCWATLNIISQEEGAYHELISNSTDKYKVYANNAPYAVKDTLKQNGFFWNSDVKAWYKEVSDPEEVVNFLQDNKLASPKVVKIPANRKYSSEV